MKLILTFFSCFLLLSGLQGNAQIDLGLVGLDVTEPEEAQGTPYINDQFETIKVKGYEGQNYSARFNAALGEMEVKIGEDIVALDPNGDFKITFTRTNKIYITVDYLNINNNKKRDFLVLLRQGENHQVFKKEIIKFYEKVKAKSSYHTDKPARYKKEEDEYYVRIGDQTTYISNKKKQLLKDYPNLSSELKSFLKEEKISLKSDADFIKVAEFITKNN